MGSLWFLDKGHSKTRLSVSLPSSDRLSVATIVLTLYSLNEFLWNLTPRSLIKVFDDILQFRLQQDYNNGHFKSLSQSTSTVNR